MKISQAYNSISSGKIAGEYRRDDGQKLTLF